jgi:hypothetical protein
MLWSVRNDSSIAAIHDTEVVWGDRTANAPW